MPQVRCPHACGTPTTAAVTAATGIVIDSPSRPPNRSPTGCVSTMYVAQHTPDRLAKRDPDRVDSALPRLGEQQHPDERERRPHERAPVVAADDRHAERAEELDRDSRPERDAVDGGEEGEGQQPGGDAERERSSLARAG